MKIELTEEQIARLKSAGNANPYNAVQAVIKLYESEMRPKDAAPVMWRRLPEALPEGEIFTNGISISDEFRLGDKFFLTIEDILQRIPFPADPTPEEKAKEEMEAAWKSKVVDPFGPKECFEAGFMAAKFPAEGGVKP